MIFTYDQIGRWLKLSKSPPVNGEPYKLLRGHGATWYEIINRHGNTVGQITMAQLIAAKLMHSGGCSNQNAIHPDGAFIGAGECGCQGCQFCGCTDCKQCSCGAPCEHGCSGLRTKPGDCCGPAIPV